MLIPNPCVACFDRTDAGYKECLDFIAESYLSGATANRKHIPFMVSVHASHTWNYFVCPADVQRFNIDGDFAPVYFSINDEEIATRIFAKNGTTREMLHEFHYLATAYAKLKAETSERA